MATGQVVHDWRRSGRNPALIAQEGDPMKTNIELPIYSPPPRGGAMLPLAVAIVVFWALIGVGVRLLF